MFPLNRMCSTSSISEKLTILLIICLIPLSWLVQILGRKSKSVIVLFMGPLKILARVKLLAFTKVEFNF